MTSPTLQVDRRTAWWILFATGLGAFIAQMFGSVIATALPAIQNDLKLTTTATAWIATAYFLTFGIGLILGGRMADLWGEVKIIVIGYIIFGATLILAALAPDGITLNIARALQGLGIGIAAPATLSIVVNVFPVNLRGLAVGTWGFAHSVGIAIGPILGGVLTQTISWRYIFWVTVPLTAIMIVALILSTRHYTSPIQKGRYDWLGAVFGAGGLVLLVYGLQEAGVVGWSAPMIIGLLVGAVVLLVAFFFIERRIKIPLVDFQIFKRRLFAGGFIGEFAIGFVYVPMLTLISGLYMVTVLGYDPITAGVLLLVLTGVAGVIQPFTGRLVDLIGARWPITIGLVLAGIALIWLLWLSADTTFLWLVPPFILMGLGAGTVLPAGNTSGMLAIKDHEAGMASGVLQTAFVICNSIGLAIVVSLTATFRTNELDKISDPTERSLAEQWADKANAEGTDAADKLLSGLSPADADKIREDALNAFSVSLGEAFFILGIISLIAAVAVFFVIGKGSKERARRGLDKDEDLADVEGV